MADTTDHAAPAGYDLYAGYVDGAYRSFPFLEQQFPGRVVSITVLGDASADVADVEAGDITPAHVPGWVLRKGAHRYMLWIADYDVPRCPLSTAVAWQKRDHGPNGENIDVSEVYDDGWPYAEAPTIYCPWSLAGPVVRACTDAGLVFAPAGAVTPAAPPSPIEEEDPMFMVGAPDRPAILLLAGGSVFVVTDGDSFKALGDGGVKGTTVTGAQWDLFYRHVQG